MHKNIGEKHHVKWFAEAASNIALIKYMGRKDEAKKIPANASFSYTLPHLKSFVELEVSSDKFSCWEPFAQNNLNTLPLILSDTAQRRFIEHLMYVRDYFHDNHAFIIRSCNNFPQASGLASSASSFAALTLATVQAISALTNQPMPTIDIIAQLSRQGSGSACRSLYAPWALWEDETAKAIDIPAYPYLIHQAIIISSTEKKILSSMAHQQVHTSPFYADRVHRAETRLMQLLAAFQHHDWQTAYQITWDEFQDMHHLFETAQPAFYYKNTLSDNLLASLRTFWDKHGDGPLITMDAGPNIHLLYRPDQRDLMEKIQQDYLKGYTYVFGA